MRYILQSRVRTNQRILSVLLVAALALLYRPLCGQEVTAAITGVISDPSGAAVPNAKVTAKDLDRGTVFTTTTGSDGAYNLTRVPVGRYEVRVEASGFQAAVVPETTLILNQIAKIDVSMTVGSVNQTLEVTAAAPVLQTESTQLGTVLDARTNAQLPLATRNYVQLTLLAPGTVTTNPSTFTGPQTTFNSGRPLVNGNREQTDNFILDGMDNNQVSENAVGYTPSVDAIQEFNMITQNASADFGNFMGGIISVSIKGGTNQFHGDAFEFFRNNVLNANNWANNWSHLPRPQLRWNEFGGTFGGPIKKDKLFFFGDYQGSRYDQPSTSSVFTVLTPQERAGNYSQLLTQAKPIQLVYPFTKTPIPGNNLAAAGLVSPQAAAIVASSLYPQPTNNALVNNSFNTTHTSTNQDQGDVRVDYTITDKDHLFGRYSQAHIVNPSTNSIALLYNSENTFPSYNGVLNYTHSFSPSFVNELRSGVNYIPVTTGQLSGTAFSAASVGIPGVPTNTLPGFVFTGGNLAGNPSGIAFGNPEVFEEFADTVIEGEDTAIITKGVHTMRAGFQVFRDRINTFYSGNAGIAGQFGFSGQYTGAAEADFMAGLPYNVQGGIAGGTWGQRSTVYGAFFQDDWHVRRNLTLNLGLRWELHTPWVEVHNRQANFNEVTGQIELAGQNGNSRALYNQYNGITNFQPRIGVAFTPYTHTVVRAAYTASNFLEGTGTNLRLTLNPPFATEHNINYLPTQMPSTLAQGYTVFGQSSASNINYTGVSLRVWSPNFRPAVSNQWNFTVQQEFGASTTLQIGYVGQSNHHLTLPIWMSQLFLPAPGATPIPYYLGANPTLLGEIGNAKLTDTNGNQSYNALQISLQKRLSGGLEFQANYTLSKCLTDGVGYYGGYGQAVGNWYYWQNTYNSRQNYGPCYYDVTNAFNGFITYDIPYGRGRTYGKNLNKVANAFIGDWQINWILTFRGGFPITVDSGVDNSTTHNPNQLANCIAPGTVYGTRNSPTGGYQWFNPAAYTPESHGNFGTCGVGTIRGPGISTVDLSLTKTFPITERQNLEFRAEAINFTNTVILNGPSESATSSTLGQITSSQGQRNIQFALKYSF
ncbi:MAG: carboxypeptidase regulatory-like domain-containing protein [Acidobacteriaceae bacterium]|nr:carboxypeptidase regulatory-like domain-containing protein [Acidobacteriaceae bacterium]